MTRTTSWSTARRSFPTRTRDAILTRDQHTCQGCGHHDPTGATLIADHVIPHAEGGPDTIDNGSTLCTVNGCHDEKTRQEQARGRARQPRRTRPKPAHPGLL